LRVCRSYLDIHLPKRSTIRVADQNEASGANRDLHFFRAPAPRRLNSS